MATFIPIIFAVVVGIVYYASNQMDIKHKSYYPKILSFSAGVSITYLLLDLFPTFTEVALSINKIMFVSVLVGFIMHHLIEKEIYIHNRRHDLVKRLKEEEHVFSFVYHVILGIVLVTFAEQSIVRATLFFIPIASFVFVSTLPTRPHERPIKSFLLAGATLIGVLFALFVWTQRSVWAEFILVGLATGVLLFTIIRHHIPFGRKGKIGYFTLGFILYSVLIVSSWFV